MGGSVNVLEASTISLLRFGIRTEKPHFYLCLCWFFVLLALHFLKRVLGAMAPQEGPIPDLFGAP